MPLKKFGQRLKELRTARKLTQVEMAEKLQCNYRHYQEIEAGRVDIRQTMLLKILDVLQAPPSLLLEDYPAGLAREVDLGLESVLDQIIEPVSIIGPDGIVIYMNPACGRVLRANPLDLIGKGYGWDPILSEEGKQKLKDTIQWVIAERPKPFTYVVENEYPDGSWVKVGFNWNYLYRGKNLVGFISVATSVQEGTNSSAQKNII